MSEPAAPATTKISEDGRIPTYKVPVDDGGFLQSFDMKDEKGIKDFFEQFGFVIIRDVLSAEDCKATIDDIWGFVENRVKEIKRDDPSTWDNKNWGKTGLSGEGIVGYDPIWTQRAILNRQNPNLQKACSILLGREDLVINHDRYGLFRPTNTVEIGGKPTKQPFWRTMLNIHLDMNPWFFCEKKTGEEDEKILSNLRYKMKQDFIEENNRVGVLAENKLNIQCLLNLADNREQDGGFQVVPGFKHHLKEWAFSKHGLSLRKQYGDQQTFIVLKQTDPLYEQAIRVTARAGSAVIWDQRTTHGSRPNNSNQIRYAQFFKMFPAPMDPDREKGRIAAVTRNVKASGLDITKLSPTGAKVLGLVPWKESTEPQKESSLKESEQESLDEDES